MGSVTTSLSIVVPIPCTAGCQCVSPSGVVFHTADRPATRTAGGSSAVSRMAVAEYDSWFSMLSRQHRNSHQSTLVPATDFCTSWSNATSDQVEPSSRDR